MTEARQDTVTPHADPELAMLRDRCVKAAWALGVRDAEGWQTIAQLYVSYTKGRGYEAVLTTDQAKQDGSVTIEKFSFGVAAVRIYTQPATRFNRKKLDEAYAGALAELRHRYDTGVPEVVSIFRTT